jgi:hypothetical protein
MQKPFLTAGVVLIFVLSSFAQRVEPVPAPDDVVLELGTEDNGHQFHLGELIPVKFSYRANIPDRYVWVSESAKLEGGRSLEISCSPAAERVRLLPSSTDDLNFGQMLNSCGGVGGGVGGGCGDCDEELSLKTVALTFGVVPLNTFVRFRTSGTYTCEASSAQITAASRDESIRPALLVKSKPIILNIVDDPAWARSAASAYEAAYDKLCRGDDAAERRLLQCFDVAQRITYLDTADSLATEVKAFDGRDHGWATGFWEAIQHSSHPQEALSLMTSRMQEPDFQVSTSVLEWLASSELRMEVPQAFQSGRPANYHAQAVEKLRKYVRLLGSSLSKKNNNVLRESAKTYRIFAEQKYCERQSLISKEEQKAAGSP